MPHRSTKTATLLCASLALSLGSPVPLWAASAEQASSAEAAALRADIPAQPLAAALAEFARQTGLHPVYVSSVVRDQKSHAVPAGLGAAAALAGLLEGSGLRFEFLTRRSVRILVAAQAPGAQSTGAPAEPEPPYSAEVVVTGSRIPVQADVTTAGPLQVVTARELLLSGHTDAVDIVGALPQMVTTAVTDFGNHSSPSANAGGVTTADLRGLRPQRTLVLINGRRLGVGDPNTNNPAPAPDLDQIPLALLERVEVLTGGASATYGADAVAGVVNFILKDHVQGVQIDAQYQLAQHTQQNRYLEGLETAAGSTAPSGTGVDGFRRDVSVLAGSAFSGGDGQLTGYVIYHGQDAVRGSDRDFAACPVYSNNYQSGVPTDRGLSCGGSVSSNLFATDLLEGVAYSVVGNRFVPWPAGGAVPPAVFNYAPYEYAQRDDVRYQAGTLGQLRLSRAARLYLEFAYMHDQTRTGIAPSGLFAGENRQTADGGYLVNCSNPLLSPQEAAILCTPAQIAADRADPGSVSADVVIGRRNVEGAGRLTSYEHRSYRAVGGVDGRLGDDWSYNAYALYYYTSLFQGFTGFLSTAAVNRALQVTTDQSGRPVCISGGRCVPYDIFSSGAVTAEQLADLYAVGTSGGANSEQIVEADVTGQLAGYGLVAPWAHDGAALNAGVERRTDGLRFTPDAVELSGDLSGWDTAIVALDKRLSVNEGFVEIRAPIMQDRPLAKDLTVDAAYRYSAYSFGKTTNTYKFDLQFAPVSDIRLRSSYNRVVRAPNLIELYTPLSYGISPQIASDPCAPTDGGATHAAASLDQCRHTGVNAAQYGDGIGPAFGGTSKIAQCAFLGCGRVGGGNPALTPEAADTWSVGVTLTPTPIPSLFASVDYFHIRLKKEIGTVPDTITLYQCLNSGDPTVCSQVVRTAAGTLNGGLSGGGYILGNSVNTGEAAVAGIDVQGGIRQSLPGRWGTLTANLSGSWLLHNTSTPYQGAQGFDCAGLFGNTCLNGSVNPKWRHNLRVTWETPWNAQLSAQWRFVGHTDFDNNSSQALLQNQEEGFFDPVLTRIPSYSYLDLSAVWAVTRNLQVRIAVDNVFDKDPPLVPQEVSVAAGGLNTFPTYDVLGRDIAVAVRATF
jgi:outer membrane receptor protein involved in Fe transport